MQVLSLKLLERKEVYSNQTPKPGDVIFYKKSHTGVVVVNGNTVYYRGLFGHMWGIISMVAMKTRTVGDAQVLFLGWVLLMLQ